MSVPEAGVLLIDLENMIGQKPRPNTLIPRIDALLRQAGPGLQVVAACAGTRISPKGMQILHDRGARVLVVDGAKDAADEALLEEARRLAAIGHHRFVVASADSAFAQLADLGQLEIMLWQTQEPRKNAYTDRATRIHRVALPHNGTSKKTAASPPQKAPVVLSRSIPPPVKATPAKVTPRPPAPIEAPRPSADAPVPAPTPSTEAFPRLVPQRRTSDVAAALLRAGSVFAAGTLFGAGTVVGAHVARHLLRPFER